LAGAAHSQLKQLQSVQNTAARLVSGLRSSTLWPYVTISPLAFNTSASHLQNSFARVEVCPWYCSCISAGTLCPGRRRPRASMATVCIYSMYSVTDVEDVNRTAKFCVPWAVSLEQFVINSAGQQFVAENAQRAAKDVSLQSWTITNTIRRCWDVLWSWRRL